MAKRHPVLTAFGLNVCKQREAQGLTQEALAENPDLDQTYVSGIKRGAASIHKDFAAVVFEKLRSRFGEFFRQMDWLALVDNKALCQCGLRKITLQPPTEHDTQFLIERDEAAVKRCIVKRREAQAVSRVQPFSWKVSPRFDMARDQKTGHSNSGNTAANAVSVENSLPEKLLPAANPNRRPSFRRSGRRYETYRPLQSHSVTIEEVHLLVIVLREEIMKQLLACRTKSCHVGLKFVPHNLVLLGSTFESFDASRSLHRIERREIAELHRETVRRPPHLPSDFNNDRVAVMEFSERQLAIKVERNEQVLACPRYSRSFCHAGRLPEIAAIAKRESACRVWQTWPGASAEL